jgi:hypothetical protein
VPAIKPSLGHYTPVSLEKKYKELVIADKVPGRDQKVQKRGYSGSQAYPICKWYNQDDKNFIETIYDFVEII